ncbi:MAG TPA: hypothetical protein VK550_35750 [Polyangiaceae bacterium]|nr:hypothetical protein [Polyangiaceae bacterium]
MTSSDRCSAASARFSRETPSPRPSAEVHKGRPLLATARRPAAVSTFAQYLDLLAKEEGVVRKVSPLGLRAHPPDAPSIGAEGSSDASAAIANAPSGAEDTRRDPEKEGAFSGTDHRDATLDPMMQVLGALAPRSAAASATARPEPAVVPDVRAPIEQLMAKLVRRVAWSGNGRTGVARLELGGGELEGATLTIHADDGLVRVALDLPPGVDRAVWKTRISERLALRGLQVEAVEVA